jgi:hypothetical protein
MDDRVIAEAKAWARAHDVSLSEVVANYFAHLSHSAESELSPWTRRLVGAAAPEGAPPTDAEVRTERDAYLNAKYR